MSSGSVTNWIELFRCGDQEAAEILWKRYFAPLVAVARVKLGTVPSCPQDAEDIALSAFHALYRAAKSDRLPEMSDRDGLWQSLMMIASGKALDARRRQYSLKRGGTQTMRTPIHLLEVESLETPDPKIAAMLSEQFERLLSMLEERELQEIALYKLEGFTNEEIGQKLQCSERTVKRRLAVIRRIWEASGIVSPEG